MAPGAEQAAGGRAGRAGAENDGIEKIALGHGKCGQSSRDGRANPALFAPECGVVYTITPFMVYLGVIMALNLKNAEVERLAADVARMTGESKTEAIRRALEERQRRLKGRSADQRRARVLRFLDKRVWSTLPEAERGRRLTRAEEDDILGLGPDGV